MRLIMIKKLIVLITFGSLMTVQIRQKLLKNTKRRFIRLKEDLSKKNIFILLTRHYYIEKNYI